MSEPLPEFSRLVPLARLGADPYRHRVEASVAECERLARRFDLVSLDRLAATVILVRTAGGLVRLDAVFEAEFAQTCVISLEPVAGAITQSFSLVYGPVADPNQEIVLAAEEPAFEQLTGDAIDIGEAVAQELSLALPDFPRAPDAAVEPIASEEIDDNAFAALARLRARLRD
jgi:uncharacterized metal-binding protein YceD (DUF177 family)